VRQIAEPSEKSSPSSDGSEEEEVFSA